MMSDQLIPPLPSSCQPVSPGGGAVCLIASGSSLLVHVLAALGLSAYLPQPRLALPLAAPLEVRILGTPAPLVEAGVSSPSPPVRQSPRAVPTSVRQPAAVTSTPPAAVPVQALSQTVSVMTAEDGERVSASAIALPKSSTAPATLEASRQPALEAASVRPGPPQPEPLVEARFDAAYLANPKPRYPPMSRRLGEEGVVRLKVRVGEEGQALQVDLDRGSGFPRLDKAAQEAVAAWRFIPARRGNTTVVSWVVVPLAFHLD